MALDIGGRVPTGSPIPRQYVWAVIAVLLVIGELALGWHLYQNVKNGADSTTAGTQVPVSPQKVLASLTPTASTTASSTTPKINLKPLTPPVDHPVDITPEQESSILKSLTPQK